MILLAKKEEGGMPIMLLLICRFGDTGEDRHGPRVRMTGTNQEMHLIMLPLIHWVAVHLYLYS